MSDTPTSVMHAMLGRIRTHSTDYWKTVTELTDIGPVISVETPEGERAFKVRAGSKNVHIDFAAGLFDADFEVEPDGPVFDGDERVRSIQLSVHHTCWIAVRPDGTSFCRVKASLYLEDSTARWEVRSLMLLAQARLLLYLGV
jgi:hypothetical protein